MIAKYRISPAVLTNRPEQYQALCVAALVMTKNIHIDIMDGHFVSTKSISQNTLSNSNLPHSATVHLMVKEPLRWLNAVKKSGVGRVIIHAESHQSDLAYAVYRKAGFKVGLAIKYRSSLNIINNFPHLNWIHILNGPIGHYGTKAHFGAAQRVALIKKTHSTTYLSADVGLNLRTIPRLFKAGLNEVVVGSYIWHAANPFQQWSKLQAQRRTL